MIGVQRFIQVFVTSLRLHDGLAARGRRHLRRVAARPGAREQNNGRCSFKFWCWPWLRLAPSQRQLGLIIRVTESNLKYPPRRRRGIPSLTGSLRCGLLRHIMKKAIWARRTLFFAPFSENGTKNLNFKLTWNSGRFGHSSGIVLVVRTRYNPVRTTLYSGIVSYRLVLLRLSTYFLT